MRSWSCVYVLQIISKVSWQKLHVPWHPRQIPIQNHKCFSSCILCCCVSDSYFLFCYHFIISPWKCSQEPDYVTRCVLCSFFKSSINKLLFYIITTCISLAKKPSHMVLLLCALLLPSTQHSQNFILRSGKCSGAKSLAVICRLTATHNSLEGNIGRDPMQQYLGFVGVKSRVHEG